MRALLVLALVSAVHGVHLVTIRPDSVSEDTTAHPKSESDTAEGTKQVTARSSPDRDPVSGDSHPPPSRMLKKEAVEAETGLEEDVMESGELNPKYYPAQRAAKVAQHYLNTRYGSPYKWVGLDTVYSATAEEVGDSGRKYHVEISVQEYISNTTEKCTAEVLFSGAKAQHPPQVTSLCEGLLKINSTAQEEALYNQYNTSQNLLSAHNLPDSYGHIDPALKPFWHLGGVASSYVMLKESTENTLYNMADVENVTQLETENNQLRFNYDVRLHEMISQEIIPWKMLVTWSPEEGVNVLQMERFPKCDHCAQPQKQ